MTTALMPVAEIPGNFHVSRLSHGPVRKISDDAEAIQAVHDFLNFQIQDHQTGDPLEVQK